MKILTDDIGTKYVTAPWEDRIVDTTGNLLGSGRLRDPTALTEFRETFDALEDQIEEDAGWSSW